MLDGVHDRLSSSSSMAASATPAPASCTAIMPSETAWSEAGGSARDEKRGNMLTHARRQAACLGYLAGWHQSARRLEELVE